MTPAFSLCPDPPALLLSAEFTSEVNDIPLEKIISPPSS